MRSKDRLSDTLRAEVAEHAKKLRKRLKRARAGDVDGVHDSRTMLRRLRTELEVMADTVFDRRDATRVEERLHRLEAALAKLRDTDVLLADTKAYARKRRADLAPLVAFLEKRRAKAARAARRDLGSSKEAPRAIRSLLTHPRDARAKDPSKATPRLVRHFTHEEIWRTYDAIRAYDVRFAPDAQVLHRMRSACRRLRFVLELFGGALPNADRVARDLHRVQDEIGELHDHHVAALAIARWLEQGKLPRSEPIDAYLAHRAEARDALRERLEARWLTVLGRPFRERLASVLEREAA
jgi:CHAD domain-containing protein